MKNNGFWWLHIQYIMQYREVIDSIKILKSFPMHVKFFFAKVVQDWGKKDNFIENQEKK